MIWQDILIGLVSVGIAFSIVPQIYHNYKTKKSGIILTTSFVGFMGAYLIAFAFITFDLYLSFVITTLNGTCWLVLFLQKIKYK